MCEKVNLTGKMKMFTRNDSGVDNVIESYEAFQILQEMSKLLDTGLDPVSLAYCIRLIERGAHPEALAQVILDIKREVNALKEKEDTQSN